MEAEPTEKSPYWPATSPLWAQYYKRARESRRFGKGQHGLIRTELKRRRRQAHLMILASTVALAAVISAFFAAF
jgi:hypothetical protein